jgi:hypothetical protein
MFIYINKIVKNKNFLGIILVLILIFSIRGKIGNPTSSDLLSPAWQQNGPFELSPERGRFALLYSLVENKTFYYTIPLARFVAPDLGFKNNYYVSLFAPGISFLIIPGYVIGKFLGVSQIGAVAIISLFAVLNAFLIQRISRKMGASNIAGIIASLVFLFATPAFTYAVTIYQHHVSTFLILMSIYILLESTAILPLFFVWFLCAMSIPVDYPNLFLMLPIGIYGLKQFFEIKNIKSHTKVILNLSLILSFLGLILPLVFFMWFNQKSYGNPFQLSGTVQTVQSVDANGKPAKAVIDQKAAMDRYFTQQTYQKTGVGFFKPRNIINGLYIHLISPDRGIIYYTPIVLFGIVGLYILYRQKHPFVQVFIGIALSDILLYSMWGDPWGGWAFGSRYMIPAYAILSVAIAFALDKFKQNIFFILLFFIILTYSIGINSLGALTSSAIPPQVEVLSMEKLSGQVELYTYARNMQYLNSNISKSFVWQSWLKKNVTAWQYYWFITFVIESLSIVYLIKLYRHQN